MRKILNTLLLLSFLFLWSCKPKLHVMETVEKDTSPSEIPDYANNKDLFLFPSDVLYVIGREYQLIADTTSEKHKSIPALQLKDLRNISFAGYMEQRLIELYPQRAFKGMISQLDTLNIYSLSEQPFLFPDSNKELAFAKTSEMERTDSFHPFISPEDEISYLNMTPQEKEKYLALNKLAESEKFADTADFDKIKNDDDSIFLNLEPDDISFFLKENILLPAILFTSPHAYLYYRIKLSKERAVYMAKKYYQEDISCGKKGDAFKHLYVSMMLRRYLSENISYLVMDLFWENQGNNSPCDKHMDLHNNYVGRHTQYRQFRGNFLDDMYDWKSWSNKIHSFVENENNGIQKKWNKRQVEQFILHDSETASKSKYIFWNKESQCEN